MENKYNSEDLYNMAATLPLSECPMSNIVDCAGCERWFLQSQEKRN